MHCPVVASQIRIALSLDPVATKLPALLTRSSFGLGCSAYIPSVYHARTRRKLKTDLNPSELTKGSVGGNGREDGDLDDMLVPSKIHLGLTRGDIPYPGGLRSRNGARSGERGRGRAGGRERALCESERGKKRDRGRRLT